MLNPELEAQGMLSGACLCPYFTEHEAEGNIK